MIVSARGDHRSCEENDLPQLLARVGMQVPDGGSLGVFMLVASWW